MNTSDGDFNYPEKTSGGKRTDTLLESVCIGITETWQEKGAETAREHTDIRRLGKGFSLAGSYVKLKYNDKRKIGERKWEVVFRRYRLINPITAIY